MSPGTAIAKIAYAEALLKAANHPDFRFLGASPIAERNADEERVCHGAAIQAENQHFMKRLEMNIAGLRERLAHRDTLASDHQLID